LASKSKIPPQLRRPLMQVGELGGDLVGSFGFHGLSEKRGLYRRQGS
jgi:hypothetical protein